MKPEKEKTDRKRTLIGLGIILAGLLLGGITWYLQSAEKQEKKESEKTDQKTEATDPEAWEIYSGTIQIENLDGLYFLSKEEEETFREEVAHWCYEEKIAAVTVTVYDVIEELSESKYRFYLTAGDVKVKGLYEDGAFSFERTDTFPESSEETDEDYEVPELTEDDQFVIPDAGNAEVGDLNLQGTENLPKEVDQNLLKKKLMEVLDKDGELRRYLTIGEVQETERGWQFYVTFDHQRVDHKELYVLVPKNPEDLETSYVVRLELMEQEDE